MTNPMLPTIHLADAVVIGSVESRFDSTPGKVAQARAACEAGNALVLVSAFDPEFLQTLQKICRHAEFVSEHVGKIGWRTVEKSDVAGRALRFVLGRPSFLRWIETAMCCDPLRQVIGVIAEMAAGTDQQLDWHDDRNDGGFRRLGITLHLSDVPYEGGLFELREKDTDHLLVREGVLPAGTIVLFRIDDRLQHRVTPVTHGGPRRAFTGWITI